MTDLKRPDRPEKCPECGQGDRTEDYYYQTPGPSVPAFHNRIQKWTCGHTSQQWWFQRYEDDILAAGIGEAPTAFWSDYQRLKKSEYPKQEKEMVDSNTTMQMIPAIVLPEPKPYYGLDWNIWVGMNADQREEARATYYESVGALQKIYSAVLEPIAIVRQE